MGSSLDKADDSRDGYRRVSGSSIDAFWWSHGVKGPWIWSTCKSCGVEFILTLRDAELGFTTCAKCRKAACRISIKKGRGEMIQLELALFEREEGQSLGQVS